MGCTQVKDAGDFGRWSASPDGLKARCKECSSVPAAAAQRAGPAGAGVAAATKVSECCHDVHDAWPAWQAGIPTIVVDWHVYEQIS